LGKKKVLLLAPDSFGLYKLIAENLAYLGYDVVHIQDRGYPFSYDTFGQRVLNVVRKLIFRDKSYKGKLQNKLNQKKQLEGIEAYERFDFSLVLRADFFDKNIIALIRQKTDFMLSFHFDGIGRDPIILDYVSYFDRFYVFDESDVKEFPNFHFRYSPNFYFDFPFKFDDLRPLERNNIYYVSTFHESRVEYLSFIYHFLKSRFDSVKFIVVYNKHKYGLIPDDVKNNMKLTTEVISFQEQLRHVSSSDLIIDLVISEHNGYSFRILEGLRFAKKVITTNVSVRNADFYHPNNYFIIDSATDSAMVGFNEFLEQPYFQPSSDILKKYSFTNWLNTKLNIDEN
jgi:hypothetical protein